MCRLIVIIENLEIIHGAPDCISLKSVKIALNPGQGRANTENGISMTSKGPAYNDSLLILFDIRSGRQTLGLA